MGNNLYERAAKHYQQYPWHATKLKVGAAVLPFWMYGLYMAMIVVLCKEKRWGDLVLLIGTTGSGFVLVTVLRRLIAAPRPFEVYRFTPMLGRHRPGLSFPSRHLYSAAVITAASVWVFGWQTVYLNGVITLLLAIVRVIGGVHFIRDVVAGAAIGALFGGIGFWLIPWLCQ